MLARRLTAQLLAGPPARDTVAVCERLLAVQGQDPRAVRLAVRARTRALTAADVDRALGEREVLITWLNRGTLHLVRREDYPWLHALTAPQHRTAIMRRLGQEGVTDPDRGVAAIERALGDEGPLAREALRDRVAAAGVRTEGQALIHLLALAALEGLIVRGPMAGKQHAYVLVRDWLGEQAPVDRDAALAELARRYLAGHAPAGDRDLARWAGITLRDARAGLAAIAGEVREREGGLVELAPPRRPPALPPSRLLGGYEPVLLGWVSRDEIVGPHRDKVTVEGLFRSFAMVGGRAVATWKLSGGEIELNPLEEIAPADAAGLDEDAADVRRFLGV
jgi:hypothetical protein